MTSKIIVNTIEADTGISSVTFASNINLQNDSSILVSSSGIRLGTGSTIAAPSANEITLSTNSAERVRITSGGLVGINTDIPSNTLQVVDTSGTAGSIDWGPSANRGRLYASSSGIFVGSVSNHDLILRTNNTERARIDNNGKVGIGTENPLNGVDIVQSDSRTRVTAYGHIITRNHNHSVTNYWSIAPRNGGELDIGYGPADSNGTVSADLVTIKSDGKMGVGTGSPTSLIHGQVSSGSAIITLESTATSGEASVSLKGKNSSGTVRTGIFKYDSADMFRIGTTASIPIRFETNDTERMRIPSYWRINIWRRYRTSKRSERL